MTVGQIAKNRPLRDRQITLFLLTITILATSLWAISPVRERLNQNRQLASLVSDRHRVESENAGLGDEISKLENDPAYIELQARKQLGLIKSNEEAFIVIEKRAVDHR